jgi:hypothetical protein
MDDGKRCSHWGGYSHADSPLAVGSGYRSDVTSYISNNDSSYGGGASNGQPGYACGATCRVVP